MTSLSRTTKSQWPRRPKASSKPPHLCNSGTQEPVALRDIKLVLSTIPKVNQVTKLSLEFIIFSEHILSDRFEEELVGMCEEVVRVSAGKPLELDLKMLISLNPSQLWWPEHPLIRRDEFYERIKEMIAFLSHQPNISTYFWHPLPPVLKNLTTISTSLPFESGSGLIVNKKKRYASHFFKRVVEFFTF